MTLASRRRAARTLVLAAFLTACPGTDAPEAGRTADAADAGAEASGDVGGTLVLIVPVQPPSLLPIHSQRIEEKQVADLVYERLAEIGPQLGTTGATGFTPMLAREWSWSDDSLAITFRLDPRARWHDGQSVTSADVRFTFDVNRDSLARSIDYGNLEAIDSVTAPDSATVVVWFGHRSPEQFYNAAGRLSILPRHVLGDVAPGELRFHAIAQRPVGSGRFRFVRAEPGIGLVLAADTGYHLGRAKLDRIVMQVTPDPVTATTQLLTGEADVYEAVRPENMRAIAQNPDVRVTVTPAMSYGFLAFNLRDPEAPTRPHPILADREVRRAISMALDRRAAVRSVFDTLGLVGAGPFPRSLPLADTTLRQIPYAPQAAAALLDSLGWRDRDGDGVRDRGGKPLSFALLVPSSSAFRQRFAVLLQQQLAASGIRLEIRQMEVAAFSERMNAHRFDAAMGSWVLTDGSPTGLRDTWGTGGIQNTGRYSNPAFDSAVDSGVAAFDGATRRRYLSRAFQIILDDAPAVWLYEPRAVLGVNKRFRFPALRPAAWWLDLHKWWIPAGERIERDRTAATVARR